MKGKALIVGTLLLLTNHGQAFTAESILNMDIRADLRPVIGLIQIPQTLDEHIVSTGNDLQGLRWHLKPLGVPKLEVLPDGRLRASVRYYGDVQLIRVVSLCHLGDSPGIYDPNKSWFYLDVQISGTPRIKRVGDRYIMSIESLDATSLIPPESDTKCSLANIDIRQKLKDALTNIDLTGKLRAALEGANVGIPVEMIQRTLTGRQVTTLLTYNLCVSARLTRIKLGKLTGSAESLLLPIQMTADPSLELTQSACQSTPGPAPIVE